MLKCVIVIGMLCCFVTAESPVQGVKTTNVASNSEPHTSFSFIRPGLTQTSFAFAGPSSHQSFSSSIGNPQLAQKVLPNIAHALAYRNPGLGYYSVNSVANGYGVTPALATAATGLSAYQTVDPASGLAYVQQLQPQQQAYLNGYQPNVAYQEQLAQLLALRQAQQEQLQIVQPQQVSEQTQLQQQHQQEEQPERQSQNLLGVAYSSAPSVAHVKVSGNGYKFDF